MTVMATGTHLALVAPLDAVTTDTPADVAEARAATDAAQTELAAATHAVIVASEYVARSALLVARTHALRAHELLTDPATGAPYASWARYCEVELPALRALRIELDTRVQLVAQLVEAGLTRRGVGHALHIADQTVRADLKRAETAAAIAAAQAPVSVDPTAPAATIPGEVVQTRTEPAPPAPRRASPRAITLAELDAAGPRGLTSAEHDRRHRAWSPAAWSVLSTLHRDGLVERLAAAEETGTRDGRAVYVMPAHRGERAVEAPGQGRRRRREVAPSA